MFGGLDPIVPTRCFGTDGKAGAKKYPCTLFGNDSPRKAMIAIFAAVSDAMPLMNTSISLPSLGPLGHFALQSLIQQTLSDTPTVVKNVEVR
jgi:hypothetical protein